LLTGPRKIGGQDEIRPATDYPVNVLDVTVTPLAQDSTTYTITINGTAFAYASDASTMVAEITAGLVSLINAGAEPVTATDNTTDISLLGDSSTLFTLALTDDYDDAQMSYANEDAGHEVGLEVIGMREITVSCQIYVERPDNLDPTKHAVHLMTVAQSALGLPTVLATLDTAGVSVIEEGDVNDISEIGGASYGSRANMDVRFGLASVVEERVGYIETVEISSTEPIAVDVIVGDI